MTEASARIVARRLVGAALDLEPELVPDEARIYDLVGWDSFGHLMIIQHLEEELGLTIEDEATFEDLTSFEAIVAFLHHHTARSTSAHE